VADRQLHAIISPAGFILSPHCFTNLLTPTHSILCQQFKPKESTSFPLKPLLTSHTSQATPLKPLSRQHFSHMWLALHLAVAHGRVTIELGHHASAFDDMSHIMRLVNKILLMRVIALVRRRPNKQHLSGITLPLPIISRFLNIAPSRVSRIIRIS
jgi:hypothetical protein